MSADHTDWIQDVEANDNSATPSTPRQRPVTHTHESTPLNNTPTEQNHAKTRYGPFSVEEKAFISWKMQSCTDLEVVACFNTQFHRSSSEHSLRCSEIRCSKDKEKLLRAAELYAWYQPVYPDGAEPLEHHIKLEDLNEEHKSFLVYHSAEGVDSVRIVELFGELFGKMINGTQLDSLLYILGPSGMGSGQNKRLLKKARQYGRWYGEFVPAKRPSSIFKPNWPLEHRVFLAWYGLRSIKLDPIVFHFLHKYSQEPPRGTVYTYDNIHGALIFLQGHSDIIYDLASQAPDYSWHEPDFVQGEAGFEHQNLTRARIAARKRKFEQRFGPLRLYPPFSGSGAVETTTTPGESSVAGGRAAKSSDQHADVHSDPVGTHSLANDYCAPRASPQTSSGDFRAQLPPTQEVSEQTPSSASSSRQISHNLPSNPIEVAQTSFEPSQPAPSAQFGNSLGPGEQSSQDKGQAETDLDCFITEVRPVRPAHVDTQSQYPNITGGENTIHLPPGSFRRVRHPLGYVSDSGVGYRDLPHLSSPAANANIISLEQVRQEIKVYVYDQQQQHPSIQRGPEINLRQQLQPNVQLSGQGSNQYSRPYNSQRLAPTPIVQSVHLRQPVHGQQAQGGHLLSDQQSPQQVLTTTQLMLLALEVLLRARRLHIMVSQHLLPSILEVVRAQERDEERLRAQGRQPYRQLPYEQFVLARDLEGELDDLADLEGEDQDVELDDWVGGKENYWR